MIRNQIRQKVFAIVADPIPHHSFLEALSEYRVVIPGNVHDGHTGGGAPPENHGDVYADSAYRATAFSSAVQPKGGYPRVVQTGVWGRPGGNVLHKLRAWNHHVQHAQRRTKIFRAWKRSYGLWRMRWYGSANAALQVRMTAITYHMKRSMAILMLEGTRSGARAARIQATPSRRV